LVFAPSHGDIIGGFDWMIFNNVPFDKPLSYAQLFLELVSLYQMMFAVITPLLITRAKFGIFDFAGGLVHISAGGGSHTLSCTLFWSGN
jgi:ammonia channel protein AmtB